MRQNCAIPPRLFNNFTYSVVRYMDGIEKSADIKMNASNWELYKCLAFCRRSCVHSKEKLHDLIMEYK